MIARASQTADTSPHRRLYAPTPTPLSDVGCSVKLKRGCLHELPDEIAVHGRTLHFAL